MSTILARLEDPPEPAEYYTLREESPGIAGQDLKDSRFENDCLQPESQYPIDPLLEAEGSCSPESTNQDDGNLTQDNSMISNEAQQCQVGDSDNNHDNNCSSQDFGTRDCPSADSGKRGQEETLVGDENDAIAQFPLKRQRVRLASAPSQPQPRRRSIPSHLQIGTSTPARTGNQKSARSIISPPVSHATFEDGHTATIGKGNLFYLNCVEYN